VFFVGCGVGCGVGGGDGPVGSGVGATVLLNDCPPVPVKRHARGSEAKSQLVP
jgi:hypothetical protein